MIIALSFCATSESNFVFPLNLCVERPAMFNIIILYGLSVGESTARVWPLCAALFVAVLAASDEFAVLKN